MATISSAGLRSLVRSQVPGGRTNINGIASELVNNLPPEIKYVLGSTGPTGPIGIRGPTGATGPTGRNGSDGSSLQTGPAGPTGMLPSAENTGSYIAYNGNEWDVFGCFTGPGNKGIVLGENTGTLPPDSTYIAIGKNSLNNSTSLNVIAIGNNSGRDSSGEGQIIIGNNAGSEGVGSNNIIAIGNNSSMKNPGDSSISIGQDSGKYNSSQGCISIGKESGYTGSGRYSISIGEKSGYNTSGDYSISIGQESGYSNQGNNSIALGALSGRLGQGSNSIAIGYKSGMSEQHMNTIILNGTGEELNSSHSNSLYISPINQREDQASPVLGYDSATKEIFVNLAKTFVIEHPDNKECKNKDDEKYLVHACLEGPEMGIYYRGISEIKEGEKSAEVHLPHYVDKFGKDFTVHLSPIYGEAEGIISTLPKEGKFTVRCRKSGKFQWLVMGSRGDIEVEPLKKNVQVRGDGPYKYLEKIK